jgi:hypothetical protein
MFGEYTKGPFLLILKYAGEDGVRDPHHLIGEKNYD